MRKQKGFVELVFIIWIWMIVIAILALINTDNEKTEDYIHQLEQSLVEQIQEKECYIERTKQLENIIEGTGLVVDNCECR